MRERKGLRIAKVIVAILLNAVLIVALIYTVLFAFSEAEDAAFSQNIKNIRTLTDAAANKVELEFLHHTQEVEIAADYVNKYNGVGMTYDEIIAYFDDCYASQEAYSWQLVDNKLNNETESKKGFFAVSLSGSKKNSSFVYRLKAYQSLSLIFGAADEKTLGQINYTEEFTDPSPLLEKSCAITTALRIREIDEQTGESTYTYKTLMLLIKSSVINNLIVSNNEIDTLTSFDYSGIIIDDNGDYVISNNFFQGTNFTDYIKLYNSDFTDEDYNYIYENLCKENFLDVLYFNNSRGQYCAYTIVPVQNSKWHILSMVPVNSFESEDYFRKTFTQFFFIFLTLFVIDMSIVLLFSSKLSRKRKEAEAANIAKSKFLSSMSHDIRTPMNAIIGMTVIAKENLKEEHPDIEIVKDCIKTIEISGNHLLTLINDILDISKIESDKVALSAEDFSIAETMGKIIEIIQPQINEKNFKFETHIINVNHEFVHADELRINQIFINILSNAIKYTGSCGRITVDLIEEEIPDKPDFARFTYRVSDTGIGMAPEFTKTIFDRFTRAVDTRINSVQGSGLGLSIVKQLVDLMGGTITVESELNVGSIFTVVLELPVADVSTAENVSIEKMSALLIDDDRILLDTTQTSLEKAGMIADCASNGKSGIEAAVKRQQEGNPYDVIFVDWKMHGMDGMEVVRTLRLQLPKSAKIVVMTAYNIADIEHEARSIGVNAFITKPLFRSKLICTIQALFTENNQDKIEDDKQTFDLEVLIVEDNRINRKVIEKILERYEVTSEKAENGLIAVEMINNRPAPYDLIFMDIQMPVMNGYMATEAIRKLPDPAKAKTPIYAMTADSFAEDIAKCLEKGMDGHLSKPIEVDKLVKVLSMISENKQKNQ